MNLAKARPAVPVILIASLVVGGWYLDRQRERSRSRLSGFFESQPILLSSRLGGRVARIFVSEGDSVKKGDPLLRFEAVAASFDTAQREAGAQQARAALDEVIAGPRREDILRQMAVVAEAQAALAKVRSGPRVEEVAAARASMEEARAALRQAQAGPRPQEIERARAAERQAAAHVAAAVRGPTPEERAQARARLEAADSQARKARADAARYARLFAQGAVSRQSHDAVIAAAETAIADAEIARQAYQRAEKGTPHEELEAVQQAHAQALAALRLVQAGTRPEELAAATSRYQRAVANLRLMLAGSRREDIEAARAKVDQAEAVLDEMRAGARRQELAQSRAAAHGAAASASASRTVLGERIVYAPVTGVVERLNVAVGDLVSPGVPVARISHPGDIWLRVYLPESSLSQVAVGDKAVIVVDGISEELEGYVESIAAAGEFTPANLQTPEERGRQVFGVRLRLRRTDPRVKPGAYATVKSVGGWR